MERTLQTNGKAAQKLLGMFSCFRKNTHPVLKSSTIASPMQSCELPVRYLDILHSIFTSNPNSPWLKTCWM